MKGRLLLVVFLVTVLVSTLTTARLIPVKTNENNTKVQKMNETEREGERSLVTPVERNITSRVGQVERKNKTTQENTNQKGSFSLPSLPSVSYLPEALLFIFGGVAGWIGHALKIKRKKSKSKEEIEL